MSSSIARSLARLALLVGATPVHCFHVLGVRLCVKLEYVNPTGSHKDRIAVNMLRAAAEEEKLRPGSCVAEISSGNTAAAVAWAASLVGLKPLLFVEKRASAIKKSLISGFGGEIIEIGDEGLTRDEAIRVAEEKGCLVLDQSSNPYNHLAHYHYTGLEILRAVDGYVDAFVMGVGTGGTITGVGRRLKEEVGSTLVVAVTPKGSAIAGGSGADSIEGLVSHSVPRLYEEHRSVVDRVVEVSSMEALEGSRELLRATGIAAGPSTGAAFNAVKRLVDNGVIERGSTVVIVAADHASRYPELLRVLGGRG